MAARGGYGGPEADEGAGGGRRRPAVVAATGAGDSARHTSVLRYRGSANFRLRVVCAVLSGRRLRIDGIREDDEEPGVRDYEAGFLRLIDELTTGSVVEINETGTSLHFRPGFIAGGKVTFDCGRERGIGYYVEGVLPLAAFGKKPVKLTLTGITNHDADPSVDVLNSVTLPLLRRFLGIDEGVTLKVKRRGAAPLGGGEAIFVCPVVRQLKPQQLLDQGFVKKIRGTAYTARVSPQTANRVVTSARELLNKFIPDVFIYTDHFKGSEGGRSPGFGLSLVAESTTGCVVAAEMAAAKGVLPEELGQTVSRLLCEEIRRGGCVDTCSQSLVFMLMVLSPEDVSKVRVGSLTDAGMDCLRHIRDVFGTTFKIKADPATRTVLLSCLGTGYINYAKKVT
mmetsp:Transcript_10871/g.37881  ORF Transcript_10871/g.37881 Transcript_10871/m.37881 type:complete len:396 (-) Transcript_10871:56-1243(-)